MSDLNLKHRTPSPPPGVPSLARTIPVLKPILFLLILPCAIAVAQPPASAPADLPAFDAITIKPPDPSAGSHAVGFYGKPGGRIFYGGFVKMLVQYAFNLQDYQVAGGPDWASSQWFEINAVPPEDSPSRNIKVANADPTPDQRLMLQRLLNDRFGLKYHIETRQGEVYILSRGARALQLKPPKDPDSDPRALIFGASGSVAGNNTTTDYLARRLERYLQLPVLNQTGITGAYDFDVPEASEVNQDPQSVMLTVVDLPGLKIKRSRGPIQTLVIDHIDQPAGN
jgi:uncharacterized protein (TIGR03435 family)